MKIDKRLVVTLLAIATLATRIGINITSPLLLDTLTPPASNANNTTSLDLMSSSAFIRFDLWSWIDISPYSPLENVKTGSASSANETYHEISPYFVVFGQWITITLVFGSCFLVMLIFFPHKIKEEDRKFPKHQILITGVCQGISSILVNFGYSGTRTPPYLQAILANFNIPVQFFIRCCIIYKAHLTWYNFLCNITW